jgi:DNA-binding NarL/FixJ family response regulator
MTRILIIEDEIMLSDFVADALNNHIDCEIVGKFEDGLKGVEACFEYKPDFVILDVNLPSLNGIEVLKRIKQKLPKTKVLLFSAYFNRSIIKKALKAGVEGIIEKTARLTEMNEAIDKVIAGETYFGPMVVNMVRDVMINPDLDDTLEQLSIREKEVLQLIAEGHSTKAIADKLNISVKTASTHRAHLMQKLDIHGVAELTRFAISQGLVVMKKNHSEESR